MKKIVLFCSLILCLSLFGADSAKANDDIVNWSGTFVNKENSIMMHNNSVRINKMGIGFFSTGFYKEENAFFCTGIVALGENLQTRISNFMSYKYKINKDEDIIVVSRDTENPITEESGCTNALYGKYVRMP